jgi:hypothetical protein
MSAKIANALIELRTTIPKIAGTSENACHPAAFEKKRRRQPVPEEAS